MQSPQFLVCCILSYVNIQAMYTTFAGGGMANHSRPIVLSPSDRRELQRLQRSSSGPSGLSRRARAVLLIADHISGAEVARRTGYTPRAGEPHPASLCRIRPGRSAGSTPKRPSPHRQAPKDRPGGGHDAETATGGGDSLEYAGSGQEARSVSQHGASHLESPFPQAPPGRNLQVQHRPPGRRQDL